MGKEQEINQKTVPNKYVRWLCYILLFRYVWDIQTLFEKYLPMEKIYRFIGFYIFWLIWFILFLIILYNIVGGDNFNAILDQMA